ncbi:hypothetical protein BDK51DRAFT_51828 [Blyttiomyces helicus]|uniref:Uncharacterized protein n=1 Tax=Blyttiomyces helicus TaxID=388810 RepID=A0A4P9WUG1_9FUNG|nr:hypothetical protein BDK51DRAFT_51828 [Blyttiomyces helicus]|eukprot:RKO94736.1 hypothetical protein BDK51DRAFT_51828 [Blyttiomyces helicus]
MLLRHATTLTIASRPLLARSSISSPLLSLSVIRASPPLATTSHIRSSSSSGSQPPSPPVALSPTVVPTAAKWLGVGGLIPFVGTLGIAAKYPEAVLLMQETQATYGACIMAFMGAVHWVLAMGNYGGGFVGEWALEGREGWVTGGVAWRSGYRSSVS